MPAPIEDDPQRLISTVLDTDGVLLARIDMPGRSMNVFSAGLMQALAALVDRVEADSAVRSVVITSGKSSFLAGADLAMVRGYTEQAARATAAEMFETCGFLGRLFVRMENSAKPWVAALNGIALGGGLELALACRQRIAVDDPKLQLGVPEVRLGLLPGAGGTQRLPRLAPFAAAMDLLLSGRSMAGAEALALNVVNAVVPAAELIDTAKAAARALQGHAYDALAKYPHLAQADIPDWSAERAQALATQHGIDAENFAHCPAYSAICDSVLKGARLPLAEAGTVEMHEFLRLMFSPVAGRMIRTLFLERLRAERVLAAPAGLRMLSIRHGPLSAGNAAWAAALARLKLPVVADASLGADVLAMALSNDQTQRLELQVLGALSSAGRDIDAGAHPTLPVAVLGPAGAYGRVVEIVGADATARDAATALATLLRCLPWPTPGPVSVLQRLRSLALPEQVAVAREAAAQAGAGEAAFLDVAACLSGVSPVWSGGPLSWQATATATPT